MRLPTSIPVRLAFAALLCAPPSAALADASGSVDFRDARWKVVDAIAMPDGDEIELVFMDGQLDRAAARSDGELNTFDVMRRGGNSITINLDADGPTMCLDFSSKSGDTQMSGSSCNSDFPPTIKIASRTATQVKGSMHWGEEGGEHVFLEFDLPIEGAAP